MDPANPSPILHQSLVRDPAKALQHVTVVTPVEQLIQPGIHLLSGPSDRSAVVSGGSTRLDEMLAPAEDDDPSQIYSNGYLQQIILFCCQMAGFVYMCHYAGILLLAPDVDHWCKPPAVFANFTNQHWKDISIPVDAEGHYSRCTRYDPPLVINSTNRVETSCDHWSYDVSTHGHTIVSEWDLVCDRAWLVSLLSAIFMAGAAFSVPITAYLSDRVGRRPVICMHVALLLVSAVAECFSKKFFLFAALCFVVAAAASGVQITSVIVLFEVCAPQYRTLYNTMAPFGMGAAIAFVELLRLYDLDRVWSQMMIIMPTFSLISFFYIMVESPRWLVATWHIRRAEKIVLWIARVNGVLDAAARKRWLQVKKSLPDNEEKLEYMVKTNFDDLLRSPKTRASSFILFVCWFVAIFAVCAFLLVVGTDKGVDRILSAVLQFPICPVCYEVNIVYGRRATLTSSLIVGSASCLSLMIFESNPLFTIMTNIARSAVVSSTVTLYICSMEMYPTVIRSVGVCAGYTCGRIGGIIAPLLRQLAAVTHPTAPYAVLSALFALGGVLAVHLQEPKYARSRSIRDQGESIKHQLLRSLPISPGIRRTPIRVFSSGGGSQECAKAPVW